MSDSMTQSPTNSAHGGHVSTGPDQASGEKQTQKALYITIFLVLGFLTLLEVFVPSVYSAEYSGNTKMLILCFLAILKASLVAMFFMHLDHEKKWVRWIACMPIYMGVAVILIMLESIYR